MVYRVWIMFLKNNEVCYTSNILAEKERKILTFLVYLLDLGCKLFSRNSRFQLARIYRHSWNNVAEQYIQKIKNNVSVQNKGFYLNLPRWHWFLNIIFVGVFYSSGFSIIKEQS